MAVLRHLHCDFFNQDLCSWIDHNMNNSKCNFINWPWNLFFGYVTQKPWKDRNETTFNGKSVGIYPDLFIKNCTYLVSSFLQATGDTRCISRINSCHPRDNIFWLNH